MAGEGKLCARYPCKNRGNAARAQDDIPSCSQASTSLFVSLDPGNETKFAKIPDFRGTRKYETDRIAALPPSSSQ